jgi:hypothetical protein
MSGAPPDLDKLLSQVPDPFARDAAPLPAPPVLPSVASPTRAQHQTRLVVAVAVAVVFQVIWIAVAKHRMALDAITVQHLLFGLGVPLVAAGLAWWAATSRGRAGLGAPAAWLAAGIALSPLLFALTTLLVAPPDQDASTRAFLDRAVRCVAGSSALCAVSLGLLAYAFRHAFAAASTWRTAALGVACGALAAATMSLACFHREAMHVLVGHGSMMLVGGLLGALIGRRFTRA